MNIEKEERKGEMRITIYNEDETLVNLLVDRLNKNKNIEYAAYDVGHPLSKRIVILIKAKNPMKEVEGVIADIKKDILELKSKLPAIKEKKVKKKTVKKTTKTKKRKTRAKKK